MTAPHPQIDVLVDLLRECQSALTGPAELRQRIEDVIGPRSLDDERREAEHRAEDEALGGFGVDWGAA